MAHESKGKERSEKKGVCRVPEGARQQIHMNNLSKIWHTSEIFNTEFLTEIKFLAYLSRYYQIILT